MVSYPVINAVHASKIESRLRHLAQTLGHFAHDDGTSIYPGVRPLMQAMGVAESTVRARLHELLLTKVLETDGYERHTRRFKFNLERLATNEPPAGRTRAGWRAAARRREAKRRQEREAQQRQSQRQLSSGPHVHNLRDPTRGRRVPTLKPPVPCRVPILRPSGLVSSNLQPLAAKPPVPCQQTYSRSV
jgi:hypothetical protein